jgi:DNA-binding beta-propeller fold protein YncE
VPLAAQHLAQRGADAVGHDQRTARDLEPLAVALEHHGRDPVAVTAYVDRAAAVDGVGGGATLGGARFADFDGARGRGYITDAALNGVRVFFPNGSLVSLVGAGPGSPALCPSDADGVGAAVCLNGVQGVAVEPASGTVYVATSGGGKVHRLLPGSAAMQAASSRSPAAQRTPAAPSAVARRMISAPSVAQCWSSAFSVAA